MTRIAITAAILAAFALPACGGDDGADGATTPPPSGTETMSASLTEFHAQRAKNGDVVATWRVSTSNMTALADEGYLVEIFGKPGDMVVAELPITANEWRGTLPPEIAELFARISRSGVPLPNSDASAPVTTPNGDDPDDQPTTACPPEGFPSPGRMVCGERDSSNLEECDGNYAVVEEFGCVFTCPGVYSGGMATDRMSADLCRPHPDRQ